LPSELFGLAPTDAPTAPLHDQCLGFWSSGSGCSAYLTYPPEAHRLFFFFFFPGYFASAPREIRRHQACRERTRCAPIFTQTSFMLYALAIRLSDGARELQGRVESLPASSSNYAPTIRCRDIPTVQFDRRQAVLLVSPRKTFSFRETQMRAERQGAEAGGGKMQLGRRRLERRRLGRSSPTKQPPLHVGKLLRFSEITSAELPSACIDRHRIARGPQFDDAQQRNAQVLRPIEQHDSRAMTIRGRIRRGPQDRAPTIQRVRSQRAHAAQFVIWCMRRQPFSGPGDKSAALVV